MKSSRNATMTIREFRDQLYTKFNSSILGKLQVQVRSHLLRSLRQQQQHEEFVMMNDREQSLLSIEERLINSLIFQHLQVCGHDFTLAVYAPEVDLDNVKVDHDDCDVGEFQWDDVVTMLKLSENSQLQWLHSRLINDSIDRRCSSFLRCLIQSTSEKASTASVKHIGCQVNDEAELSLRSLDYKLRSIDDDMIRKANGESTSNEHRVLEYQAAIEEQCRHDMRRQVEEIRQRDIVAMRAEERQRYDEALCTLEEQYAQKHSVAVEELRRREQEMKEAFVLKEKRLNADFYTKRQRLLNTMELTRKRSGGGGDGGGDEDDAADTSLLLNADRLKEEGFLKDSMLQSLQEELRVAESRITQLQNSEKHLREELESCQRELQDTTSRLEQRTAEQVSTLREVQRDRDVRESALKLQLAQCHADIERISLECDGVRLQARTQRRTIEKLERKLELQRKTAASGEVLVASFPLRQSTTVKRDNWMTGGSRTELDIDLARFGNHSNKLAPPSSPAFDEELLQRMTQIESAAEKDRRMHDDMSAFIERSNRRHRSLLNVSTGSNTTDRRNESVYVAQDHDSLVQAVRSFHLNGDLFDDASVSPRPVANVSFQSPRRLDIGDRDARLAALEWMEEHHQKSPSYQHIGDGNLHQRGRRRLYGSETVTASTENDGHLVYGGTAEEQHQTVASVTEESYERRREEELANLKRQRDVAQRQKRLEEQMAVIRQRDLQNIRIGETGKLQSGGGRQDSEQPPVEQQQQQQHANGRPQEEVTRFRGEQQKEEEFEKKFQTELTRLRGQQQNEEEHEKARQNEEELKRAKEEEQRERRCQEDELARPRGPTTTGEEEEREKKRREELKRAKEEEKARENKRQEEAVSRLRAAAAEEEEREKTRQEELKRAEEEEKAREKKRQEEELSRLRAAVAAEEEEREKTRQEELKRAEEEEKAREKKRQEEEVARLRAAVAAAEEEEREKTRQEELKRAEEEEKAREKKRQEEEVARLKQQQQEEEERERRRQEALALAQREREEEEERKRRQKELALYKEEMEKRVHHGGRMMDKKDSSHDSVRVASNNNEPVKEKAREKSQAPEEVEVVELDFGGDDVEFGLNGSDEMMIEFDEEQVMF